MAIDTARKRYAAIRKMRHSSLIPIGLIDTPDRQFLIGNYYLASVPPPPPSHGDDAVSGSDIFRSNARRFFVGRR